MKKKWIRPRLNVSSLGDRVADRADVPVSTAKKILRATLIELAALPDEAALKILKRYRGKE